MKYLLLIFVVFSLNACYTAIDRSVIRNEDKKESQRSDDEYLIEGTIRYIEIRAFTPETHEYYKYILDNYKWLIKFPPNTRGGIDIKSKIDSSYINKRVKIKGHFKYYSESPFQTLYQDVYLIPEKIIILN